MQFWLEKVPLLRQSTDENDNSGMDVKSVLPYQSIHAELHRQTTCRTEKGKPS